VGEASDTLALSEHLFAHEIYAPAIRPPTVPPSRSRIRLSVTAGHTSAQIDHLLEAVAAVRTTNGALWERLTDRTAAKRGAAAKDRSPSL
jgi:hypothetical protein